MRIVREPIRRSALASIADDQFGDMVKAVVDVARRVMVIGGELHSDEEALLLDDGSRQADLWGINLYVGQAAEEEIEYDSVINIRPRQGNRSRGVDDSAVRDVIQDIVHSLVMG